MSLVDYFKQLSMTIFVATEDGVQNIIGCFKFFRSLGLLANEICTISFAKSPLFVYSCSKFNNINVCSVICDRVV